jgi:hypothetical protein
MHPSPTHIPSLVAEPPTQAPAMARTGPARRRPLSRARLEQAERALAHLPTRQFRRVIGQALDELGAEWGIQL